MYTCASRHGKQDTQGDNGYSPVAVSAFCPPEIIICNNGKACQEQKPEIGHKKPDKFGNAVAIMPEKFPLGVFKLKDGGTGCYTPKDNRKQKEAPYSITHEKKIALCPGYNALFLYFIECFFAYIGHDSNKYSPDGSVPRFF